MSAGEDLRNERKDANKEHPEWKDRLKRLAVDAQEREPEIQAKIDQRKASTDRSLGITASQDAAAPPGPPASKRAPAKVPAKTAAGNANIDPKAVKDPKAVANAAVMPEILDLLFDKLNKWPKIRVPPTLTDSERDVIELFQEAQDPLPTQHHDEVRNPKEDMWSERSFGELVKLFAVATEFLSAEKAPHTSLENQALRVDKAKKLLTRWAVLTAVHNSNTPELLEIYGRQDDDIIPRQIVDVLADLPEVPGNKTGRSMLTVLIEALPPKVDRDTRQHTNVPGPLVLTRNTTHVRVGTDRQIELPFDHDELPITLPPAEPRYEVGYLPGLEPEPSEMVNGALLNLFHVEEGRGPMPWEGRMGWEVLLSPSPDDFNGRTADLTIDNATLHSILSPGTKYVPSRHGPLLREAARKLNDPDSAVRWRESAAAQPILLVMVYMPPAEPYDRGGQVGFYVTRPAGSRQGPQVDRVLLRHLRAKGWRLHRVMMAGYCIWDSRATVKGHLVDPTVPAKVRTDAAGYSISATGRLLTDSKGRPTRSTTHPKAVQIGEDRVQRVDIERYYPWFADRDLLLLGSRTVGDTPAARRKQRWQVQRTLKFMCEKGFLDYEAKYRSVRGGRELEAVRLLPSDDHRRVHAARRAAYKHGR